MTTLQKWLIVLAIWFLAFGVLLNAFKGRYRLPVLYETYATMYHNCRYDTWTGKVQVTAGYGRWERGATLWVKELK